jgi:hypothetical protein
VPAVRAARDRLVALRAELPQRQPLLAATDQELEESVASITDAEAAGRGGRREIAALRCN